MDPGPGVAGLGVGAVLPAIGVPQYLQKASPETREPPHLEQAMENTARIEWTGSAVGSSGLSPRRARDRES